MGSTTPRIVKRAQRMVDHLNEVTSTPNHFSVPVIELVVSLYPCLSFSLSLSLRLSASVNIKLVFMALKNALASQQFSSEKKEFNLIHFRLSQVCVFFRVFFFCFLYIFYSRSAGA